jgi:hypothetical protein
VTKRVFIVRPFGTRDGVDFDRVERDLIQEALNRVKVVALAGSTTIPFIEQGNIREDMFRELVAADLVIADLSIHNANVFYELGIRHAVRPNATFLLRAAKLSAYPFDLQTDRYLTYDALQPEQSIGALADALEATLTSGRVDSPVYQLLPNLQPPDPAALRVVPRDFGEAVNRARDAKFPGDLRLLAHEARSFSWASEGLRAVGRAQFLIKATAGAIETFEWLREAIQPREDVEANQRQATLYQRLAKGRPSLDEYIAKSIAAIQRVIESPEPSSWDVAEAYALKARNIKALWLMRFEGVTGAAAQIAALQAAELEQSLEAYASGFAQDRNHFYSGLNALSMLRIRLDLAAAHVDEWNALFDGDKQAADTLEAANSRFSQLAGAVELAIEARQLAHARKVSPDAEDKLWTDISAADLAFLTSSRPKAVAQKYRVALTIAPSFAVDSVRDQIRIFQRLELRSDFVGEALMVTGPGDSAVASPTGGRVLLFTGHMIDSEDRAQPRFPRTARAESAARQMIKDAILKEQQLQGSGLVGIAGGACGGDILFHEVCEELNIPTRLFLAVAKDTFSANSVQNGGTQWVERFNRLCARVLPRVLEERQTTQLPNWLQGRKDYDIWRRNNLWMLFNALALDLPLTLVALWDQGPADGPGGTRDLVAQVRERGQKIERLPAEQLKSLATT